MNRIAFLAVGCLFAAPAFAQDYFTSEDAVRLALERHPAAKAAAFEVEAKRFGERAARNLPNPEINAESPTGEFYVVGVLQGFEFPTVYKNRRKVARAETALAAAGQKLTENELRFAVRNLFLETQVADYQLVLEKRRDSLFQQISLATARQFAAGEIDFLQKTLAENEAGNARQNRLAAENLAENRRAQLKIWTGMADLEKLDPLKPPPLVAPPTAENPSVFYEKQAAAIAAQQIALAKSGSLPNFSLGYLNQGAKNTPLDYRFRATVVVPIWFSQNRAARQSAQTAALAAQSRAEAAAQNVDIETAAAQNEAAAAARQIQYFESEALPRSRSIVETATRLRTAGQIDFPNFLRTLDTAFSIENEYVVQVKTLTAAQIRLRYLQGN